MRKIICSLLLLLSLNVSAEPKTLSEILQSYLELYDVKSKVGLENDTLYIEDVSSKRSDEMMLQINYILSVIDFMFSDLKITVEQTPITQISYTSFDIVDEKVDRNKPPNLKYWINIGKDWLIQYFKSDKQERIKMMNSMFKANYENWTPTQKAKETLDTTQKAK
jgi:hypothetical protein